MAFGGETVTGSGGSAHSENLCTDLCDHWDFCEGAMDDPAVYTFLGTKSCWAFNVCDGGVPWTSDGGPENCQSNALTKWDLYLRHMRLYCIIPVKETQP